MGEGGGQVQAGAMKSSTRKLTLTRNTMRMLGAQELAHAAGGNPSKVMWPSARQPCDTTTDTCPTSWCDRLSDRIIVISEQLRGG
jgi:hypothetical protein